MSIVVESRLVIIIVSYFIHCSSYLLLLTGLRLGSMGIICLAFLFFPITRGSVLLRLVDIPFEQATRYHVWLGHLTMWLFTLHGSCYVVGWAMQGILIQEVSVMFVPIHRSILCKRY